ncbi:hypothetical protein BZA05DRAFT_472085 [Tricharina praecox]|uniref:uncharacterized protein n=1 Tax=Tricharina praecox TaxID=43433 RepID=UPI00221F57CD|nr:uncharacterized protein BZA05DRAFT_472085 [Tricharina praecox]KAI5855175.1 hypothetical protein BZA05DRAFT_472085 [Tricharina praecox]
MSTPTAMARTPRSQPIHPFFNTMPLFKVLYIKLEAIVNDGGPRGAAIKEFLDWRNEYMRSVGVVASLVVAVVATSLQFGAIATAHWTVLAFWYASIFTGFASIYLGSVEAHAMSLNRIEKVLRVFETRTGVLWRGICVFSLGLAHTFLGMCIILYLAGLVVFLLEPLRAGWGREQKAGVAGVAIGVASGLTLIVSEYLWFGPVEY